MTPTPRLVLWTLAILAGLALLVIVLRFISDPFGFTRRKVERLEQEAARAEYDAFARGLEVEGEREQATRVDTFHRQEVVIRDLTAQTVTESRSLPDADEPLDPDRLGRLRAGDERLCAVRPAACPGAPADPVDS